MTARRGSVESSAARGLGPVLALFAGVVCLTAVTGIITRPVIPDPLLRALVGIALLTVAALVARPWFGDWRSLGLHGHVRQPWLLALPALFGLSHLVNLLYRDNAGLVLAQVWGAFCFGVGYAALRRRIGSILPLMLLHAVTDFAGRVTAGPAILFFVVQDAVLLTVGLVLVLRERGVRSWTVSTRPAGISSRGAGDR